MHEDAVDSHIDGDLIDVALAHGIGEAGAEGDAEGGRGDNRREP